MSELNQHKAIRIQKWVLLVGSLLMLAKFVAFYLTKSNAILTDALESIVNVSAGVIALYSLWLSARPRDLEHPYGHGKIEFISASIEGALIFIAGGAMIIKSVYNFIYPIEVTNLDLGIVITAIAGIFNYLFGFIAEKFGKEINSIVLISEGKHLKSDAYSTLGMLLGLLVILITGQLWLDNLIAIIFGLIICYTGYKILKKSIGGIMDEADTELIEEIISAANASREENWIDLHNLRIIQYGHRLHVDAHLTVPWYLSVAEGHKAIDRFDELINRSVERPIEFFIHMDPCVPASCKICKKSVCPERKHAFEKQIEWNLDNVIADKKHRL